MQSTCEAGITPPVPPVPQPLPRPRVHTCHLPLRKSTLSGAPRLISLACRSYSGADIFQRAAALLSGQRARHLLFFKNRTRPPSARAGGSALVRWCWSVGAGHTFSLFHAAWMSCPFPLTARWDARLEIWGKAQTKRRALGHLEQAHRRGGGVVWSWAHTRQSTNRQPTAQARAQSASAASAALSAVSSISITRTTTQRATTAHRHCRHRHTDIDPDHTHTHHPPPPSPCRPPPPPPPATSHQSPTSPQSTVHQHTSTHDPPPQAAHRKEQSRGKEAGLHTPTSHTSR
jgi:hypothetical protein